MSDKLVNPHDAFFKQYLSQPAVAIESQRRYSSAHDKTALYVLSIWVRGQAMRSLLDFMW